VRRVGVRSPQTPSLAARHSSDNGGVEANAVSATAHALITKQGV